MRYIFFIAVLSSFLSCKSQFEKVRATGDPEVLYATAMEYYEDGQYLKAQTLLELVISSFRGKKEAESIYFYYAYTHYHLGKYILSSYYFKNFSNTFTTSPLREEAEFMSAYANYQLSPTFRLDQSYSEKAIEELQTFVNTYPTSTRVQTCNLLIDEMRRKLEQKAFAEGQLYFDLKQYQSAVQSFENVLKDFPESPNSEEIRFLILKSKYLLAVNSVVTKQEERFEDFLKNFEVFRRKYSESNFDKELESFHKNTIKQLKEIRA